jgi:hypothetical protein
MMGATHGGSGKIDGPTFGGNFGHMHSPGNTSGGLVVGGAGAGHPGTNRDGTSKHSKHER